MNDKFKASQRFADETLATVLSDIQSAAKQKGVELSEVTLLILTEDKFMAALSAGKVDQEKLPDYVIQFGEELSRAKELTRIQGAQEPASKVH